MKTEEIQKNEKKKKSFDRVWNEFGESSENLQTHSKLSLFLIKGKIGKKQTKKKEF